MPKVTKISSVISLQYLKKEGRDEVDILHADKHQTSKLFKLILLMLMGMAMSKLPKITSLQNLCDIPKFCILG